MCKCGEKYLTPLFYTLDDWGYKGSTVFARVKPGEGEVIQHQLMVCTKCHAVCAMPTGIIEEDTKGALMES